jgi:hypothetical protein
MSTDSPSAADYALRRDWMREWALDLDRLTVLQNQLTTTQAELEVSILLEGMASVGR